MEYGSAIAGAPVWVMKAWDAYRGQPAGFRRAVPFLYFLLGGKGTPAFKASKPFSWYLRETPIPGFTCASCPYAYEKVTQRGVFICPQVRGQIRPEAWCVIPTLRSVWPTLTKAETRRVRSRVRHEYE